MPDLKNPKKPWYNQPKTNIYASRLNNQYSNIIVSSAPMMDGMELKHAKSIDHFVNVSASEFEMNSYNKKLQSQFHWFPLPELGFWGIPTLYGFIQTMNKIYTPNTNIIVHCEAGSNRSPTRKQCWLLHKEKTLKKAIPHTPKELDYKGRLQPNIDGGHIPSINDLKYLNNLIKNNTSLENISIDERLEKYTTGFIPGKK